ncbi:MAG: radical SAM protein [Armatimonadetes bacterium]|nr:radical SAM protein [Armatimonadota bacterium]
MPGQRVFKVLRSSGWRLLLRPDVAYNWWLNRRELARKAVRVRSMPSKIEIEISNRCNLACLHCIRRRPDFHPRLGDMSCETFEAILRQFPRALTLTLTGFGEMLMHPQFLEIVATARRILPHANILGYTNGLLIGKRYSAEEIVRSGLGQIHFSLDAATPETYRKVRNSEEFDRLVGNIRDVLETRKRLGLRKPIVGVNFTIMNDNFQEAPEYVKLAVGLGVDYIARPALIMTAWGYHDGAARITRQELIDVLRETRRVAEELRAPMPLTDYMSDPDGFFADYYENRRDAYKHCIFLWNHVQIDPFGNLKLCCAHPAASIYSWGNLLETPFRELWNSEALQAARRAMREGRLPAAPCAQTCVEPDPILAD